MVVPRPNRSVLTLTAITTRAPSARAAHQPAVTDLHGREYARQRIGGAHRVDEPAARDPDLVTAPDLGCYRGEAQRQFLDHRVAERSDQLLGEPTAAEQPGAAETY